MMFTDPEGLIKGGHRTGKRKSSEEKHEYGDERRKRDQGGEKGDKRRDQGQEKKSDREKQREKRFDSCLEQYRSCMEDDVADCLPSSKGTMAALCVIIFQACIRLMD